VPTSGEGNNGTKEHDGDIRSEDLGDNKNRDCAHGREATG
jgi:hypothetical protein